MSANEGDPSVSQAGTTNEMNACCAFPIGWGSYVAEVRMNPGVQQIKLPLTNGVTQVSETDTGEYSVTLHVGNMLTLAPMTSNCQRQETAYVSPAGNIGYLFSSRQRLVVTCSTTPDQFSNTCVLTAVAPGITTVEIVSPRAVNSGFVNAEPAAVAGGSGATLIVRCIP
jgi:hypothetical protein